MPETATEIILTLPTEIQIGKRFYSVNLNTFRNLYYITKNQMKKKYTELVMKELSGCKCHFEAVNIHYKIYFGDRRRHDVTNVVAMVDKFLEDALVKCHIIDDDDYKHVRKGSWEYGGIKPGKPEIEVTISELYNKGKDYKGLDLT